MSADHLVRFAKSPWLLVLAGLAALAGAVAFAPLLAAVVVVVFVLLAALAVRFGWREGLWYLLVAVIPLRAALSVDVFGTTSLFFGDVLIFALFANVAVRGGLRDLWARSLTLRFGVAIVALSLVGLYVATRTYWGIVSIYVILAQIALFCVARDVVRTGPQATRTLLAILAGLVVPVIYGFYQASLPFGAELPEWSRQFTAYGRAGEPHLRVFSTFAHPLRFSHYLSIGFGLSVGLASSALGGARKAAALFVGLAAGFCNYFTYSIGGVIAMMVAIAAASIVSVRRRAGLLVLLAVIPLVFAFSGALQNRVEHLLGGQSSSAAARLITYAQSFNVLRDHPLQGVGWGGIRSSLEGKYRMSRSFVVAFCAENYFLQRGLALGFPGIALYVAVFVLFIRNALGRRAGPDSARWPRAAILAGGAAFYVQAQVMPSTDASVNCALWILLALAERMSEGARNGAAVGEPAGGHG